MVEIMLQPGLAMLERIDDLENLAGSRCIGDRMYDQGWIECNFICQRFIEDTPFYRDYALSLWESALSQLHSHVGSMDDLSRSTIALLKYADYDGSGWGTYIGGLNPQNLTDTNVFNSEGVEFAQVKRDLITFANSYVEDHNCQELFDPTYRGMRFREEMDYAYRGARGRVEIFNTIRRAYYHDEMRNAFRRAHYEIATQAFRRM